MHPPYGRSGKCPETTSTTPSLSAPTGLAVGLALKECATPESPAIRPPEPAQAPMGSPLPGAVATGDSAGLLCPRGSLQHPRDTCIHKRPVGLRRPCLESCKRATTCEGAPTPRTSICPGPTPPRVRERLTPRLPNGYLQPTR